MGKTKKKKKVINCIQCGFEIEVEHTKYCDLCGTDELCSDCINNHECDGKAVKLT